ncbi:MAG TPA: RNA methyltransferase [Pyrinomonadaceae bacterium]|jgi:TrmH family RNA methyltransferase|nr:RNA methyltransferase [Pyrinomonadaceae bacterium]
MTPEIITSRDNSLLRQVRAVRDGRVDDLIFVEGMRLCEEALTAGIKIHVVVFSDEIAQKEKPAELIAKLSTVCDRLINVNEKLLAYVSFSKTAQGILLLASRPDASEGQLSSKQTETSLIVIMHRITNPVNVGAILRTAEATGVTGTIATENATDPFSPKALRGAMGAAFRLPVWCRPSYAQALDWCAARGIKTVCADLHAQKNYTEFDWTGPCALILGPETAGLSHAEIAAADDAVRIPMREPVESLNVSVATGVLLYEAARQRGRDFR